MTLQRLLMAATACTALFVSCISHEKGKEMTAEAFEESAIDHLPFQKNQCLSKGGMGIVAKGFVVVLKSTRNELLLPDGKSWTGRAAGERECVFVLRGKVFPAGQLPKDFRLEKSVVISFEDEKVTFFEFSSLSGGFYKR